MAEFCKTQASEGEKNTRLSVSKEETTVIIKNYF